MNVAGLRAALASVRDDLEVIVRVNVDCACIIATPSAAEVTTGCDDEPFFAIELTDED